MSHAGQNENTDNHASELPKTANPSVGSGGWIGSFLYWKQEWVHMTFVLLLLVGVSYLHWRFKW